MTRTEGGEEEGTTTKAEHPECDYEGCDRYSKAKRGGLCNGHAQQIYRGEELHPMRERPRKYDPTCSFEGCGLAHYTGGYCQAHTLQLQKGNELTELKPEGNPWVNGRKVCPGCGIEKAEDGYQRDATRSGGYSAHCKECTHWQQIEYRYRLTQSEWLAVFELQGNRCAICGTDDPGHAYGFAVDHDHECCPGDRSCGECVRGIVCQYDNIHSDRRKTPEFLAYVARYEARSRPLKELATEAVKARENGIQAPSDYDLAT